MNNQIAALLALTSLLSLLLVAGPGSAASAPSRDALDSYIEKKMSDYGMPGLALAVVRDGKTVALRDYGLASVELQAPVTPESVFQFFSVSKLWAGVSIQLLAEEGRLTLDTPVIHLVDGLPRAWSGIRVHHLLSHTSGIPEWSANPRSATLSEKQRQTMTARWALALSAELPVKFPAGERFSYHRSGYNLLTLIVETLASVPYPVFVKERIFDPIGMASARYGDTESVVPGRPSTNYAREEGQLRNWIYRFGASGYTGSALNASVSDVARFFEAVQQGDILPLARFEELWTPAPLSTGGHANYGLGWTVETRSGRRVVGHEGGGAAWVAHYPDDALTVIVVCNLNGSRADELQDHIADFFLE